MGHVPLPDRGTHSEPMSREDKRAAAIFISIVMAIVLGVTAMFYFHNQGDADASCYESFRNTYTWEQARPELDAIWADHRITISECDAIPDINQRAQIAAAKIQTEEDYRGYKH